jgi:hypothetical protein
MFLMMTRSIAGVKAPKLDAALWGPAGTLVIDLTVVRWTCATFAVSALTNFTQVPARQ